MNKIIRYITLFFLLFIAGSSFASPRLIINNFNASNQSVSFNFSLKGVANIPLLQLIMSDKAVRIKYEISIYEKRGFFRSDKRIWKTDNIHMVIKYKRFSRVFTVYYKNRLVKTKKRFIKPRSLKRTIRLILKYFFDKSFAISIPLIPLGVNRSQNKYFIKVKASVTSVSLAPPFNIINSSFNFKIEENIAF